MNFTEKKKNSKYFGYFVVGISIFTAVLNSFILNKTITAGSDKTIKDVDYLTGTIHLTLFLILVLTGSSIYLIYSKKVALSFTDNWLTYISYFGFLLILLSLFIYLEVIVIKSGDDKLNDNSEFKNLVISIFSLNLVFIIYSIYIINKISKKYTSESLCGLYTLDINPYLINLDK